MLGQIEDSDAAMVYEMRKKASGINDSKVSIQKLSEGEDIRIIDNLYCLHCVRALRAYLFICGSRYKAVGISGLCLQDSRQAPEERLQAPEASASQNDRGSALPVHFSTLHSLHLFFKVAEGLNFGNSLASITIRSPVTGLIPMRSFR